MGNKNSFKKIITGNADFNYVFWKLGVLTNLVLAVLWVAWLIIIPLSGPFVASPLFFWILGYLPIYLIILIITAPNSELEEALKKLGIYSSIAGILIGVINLLVDIYSFV